MYRFNPQATKIFDLGGVIINIDPSRTFDAFEALLAPENRNTNTENYFKDVFTQFEAGTLTEYELLNKFNSHLTQDLSKSQFRAIWNLLLLDIPTNRLNTLVELSKKEDLYLLSNTNSIHIEQINSYLENEHNIKKGLNGIFTRRFLSYDLQLRKPDAAIYQHAINHIPENKDGLIFFDDLEENVSGSKQAGLSAEWVPQTKNEAFWNYLQKTI